jgi:tetratricopeptide (TPR) repeat protein
LPSFPTKETDRYPGALSFSDTPLDRVRFFGRKEEAQSLLHQLLSVNLLVFFGKSGVGKTSLLRAGLFPLLRSRDFLPVPIRFNEYGTPLQIVQKAVAEACRYEKIDYIAGSNGSLWEYFKTAILWRGDRVQTPVLLLDQFEEIFTLHQEEFRRLLAGELGQMMASRLPEHLRRSPASMMISRSAIGGIPFEFRAEESAHHRGRIAFTEKRPEVKILIGMREDYLGALEELVTAVPEILLNRFRLTGLSVENARSAITKPAALVAEEVKFSTEPFTYENETMGRIIAAAREEEGGPVEPFVLQLLCSHIEKQVRDRQVAGVRLEVDLSYFGGEKGIPAITLQFYFDALRQLPGRRFRRRARAMCEEGLLTGEGRRRRMLQEDLRVRFKLPQHVFETLENGRLLRKEPYHGSFYYEISHDRVAQAIYNSRKWRLPREVQIVLALIILLTLLTAAGYSYYQYSQAKIVQVRAEDEVRRIEEELRTREKAEAVFRFVLEEEDRLTSHGARKSAEDIQRTMDDYYKQMAKVAESEETRRKKSDFLINEGDLSFNRGDLSLALSSYQESLEIREKLTVPSQHALWVCYDKIGDVYKLQGDHISALRSYQKGLGISEKLTVLDPANFDWQVHLAASYEKIGDLQKLEGDLASALISYRKALDIGEKMASRDPTNIECQSGLSSTYDRIGDIQDAQRDLPSALNSYQKGLRIAERLAARDPGNTEWQSDLAVLEDKIGDVQRDLNDLSSALVHYQKGLLITEKEAVRDPDDTALQRRLSVCDKRIGDAQSALGDLASALSFYRKSLEIADKLVCRDSSNMEWRTDLVRSLLKLGGVLELQGAAQRAEAEAAYRRALALLQPVVDENRLTEEQKTLNSQLHARLEELLKKNHSRENER